MADINLSTVLGSPALLGNTVGSALGTASAGVATTAARSDHVHPVPVIPATPDFLLLDRGIL